MKESLSLPSHKDTMTGYRSIQRKQNASTHHYKRKRGSIQECSRCVLPTFQSQEFTLSTANRIFLKKDFKPKKRYILYFIIQLYQILCKGFWMTWRKTFNPQQKYQISPKKTPQQRLAVEIKQTIIIRTVHVLATQRVPTFNNNGVITISHLLSSIYR